MVIINFADMSDTELMEFWSKYRRPTRSDAEQLIGDKRLHYTSIAAVLGSVAFSIMMAHEASRRGNRESEAIHLDSAVMGLKGLPKDILKRIHLGREVIQAQKHCG